MPGTPGSNPGGTKKKRDGALEGESIVSWSSTSQVTPLSLKAGSHTERQRRRGNDTAGTSSKRPEEGKDRQGTGADAGQGFEFQMFWFY